MKILPYYSSKSQFKPDNSYQKLNDVSFFNVQQNMSSNKSLIYDVVQFGASIKSNPLDNHIGGYKKEKEVISDLLITPLNKKRVLPPSLLLAFPDDYMREQVICGITQNADANFVSLSAKNELLGEQIKKSLNDAKRDFQNTKKQTVIVVNDAQNVIGMSPAYAKELSLIPMTDKDIKYLKSHGSNIKKVNFFKSLLDMPYQNYATIVFVTTEPQYIHPDLMTRDGKMKKVIFSTPQGRNLKEIIKFEISKANDMLDALKSGEVKYPDDLAKKLVRLRDKGKLQKMRIDEENIPYQKLMRYCAPAKNKGAYSLSNYNNIVVNALKDYIKLPQTPYSMHFIFNLVSEPRAVKSESYLQFESMKKLF